MWHEVGAVAKRGIAVGAECERARTSGLVAPSPNPRRGAKLGRHPREAAVANFLTFVKSQPVRVLEPGESLVETGEANGELYVLQSGKLSVVRDGVEIARITEPGSLIGEMSVLLGIDHSATVRAIGPAEVRVVERAIAFLEATPIVALEVATMACERLNQTSAVLVQLKKELAGKGEQGFLERLFGAVSGTGATATR